MWTVIDKKTFSFEWNVATTWNIEYIKSKYRKYVTVEISAMRLLAQQKIHFSIPHHYFTKIIYLVQSKIPCLIY